MAGPLQCVYLLKNWKNVLAEDKITCSILLFAAAAEAIGCRKMELEMSSDSTVGDVFDDLAGQYAAFAKLRNTCAIALNQKICSPDTPLQENCTLAFLPPVSGG